MTQEEVNYCVVRNYKIAEHVLDSLYHSVMSIDFSDPSEPDTAAKKALIQSQKSWLKYRDDVSELVRTFSDGGSMANAEAWKYRTKLILDRIRELEFFRKYYYGKTWIKIDWKIDTVMHR